MKILYVSAISGTMDFFVDTIKDLKEKNYVVDIACSTQRAPLNPIYEELGCKHYEIDCSRTLSVKSIKVTIEQIKNIILNNDYDIVHCHTPIAAFCVRVACRSFRKKGLKVVYTAHGFHFFKGSPIKNWMIFCPPEFLCSLWTDVLVTINQEDSLLSKKMWAKKNVYIPGVGINIKSFDNNDIDTEKKKKELGIHSDSLVMMTVGDLNPNKNQQLIFKCLSEIKDNVDICYLLAGTGELRDQLEDLAKELKIENRVYFLGYRTDIKELYSICDFTVFPSLREGLSVSIMESMACGLPVICADIRGNRDLITNAEGGFLCKSNDKEEFKNAILELSNSSELRNKMRLYNKEKIKFFSSEKTIAAVEEVYEDLLK